MKPRSISLALPALLLAGCGGDADGNQQFGSTTPRYERMEEDPTLLGNTMVPVRVGELGPSFAACNGQGRIREAAADGPIPVRAAPYEQARETGQLPPGSTFLVCSRSIDQRWMGVVYDRGGHASRSCGVSAPIRGGRDYDGPCESGWVSSAQVRLTAGVEEPPVQASDNGAQAR